MNPLSVMQHLAGGGNTNDMVGGVMQHVLGANATDPQTQILLDVGQQLSESLQNGRMDQRTAESAFSKLLGTSVDLSNPLSIAALVYNLDRVPMGISRWRHIHPAMNDLVTKYYDVPKNTLHNKVAEVWNNFADQSESHYMPHLDAGKAETVLFAATAPFASDYIADFAVQMLASTGIISQENPEASAHIVRGVYKLKNLFSVAAVGLGLVAAFENELVKLNIPGADMIGGFARSVLSALRVGRVNESAAQSLYVAYMSDPETLTQALAEDKTGSLLEQLLQAKDLIERGQVPDPANQTRPLPVPSFQSTQDLWKRDEMGMEIKQNNQRAAAWSVLDQLQTLKTIEAEALKTQDATKFARQIERLVVGQVDQLLYGKAYPTTLGQLNHQLSFLGEHLQTEGTKQIFSNVLDAVRIQGRDIGYLPVSHHFDTPTLLTRMAQRGILASVEQLPGEEPVYRFFAPIGLADRSVTIPEGQVAWDPAAVAPEAPYAPAAIAWHPFAAVPVQTQPVVNNYILTPEGMEQGLAQMLATNPDMLSRLLAAQSQLQLTDESLVGASAIQELDLTEKAVIATSAEHNGQGAEIFQGTVNL